MQRIILTLQQEKQIKQNKSLSYQIQQALQQNKQSKQQIKQVKQINKQNKKTSYEVFKTTLTSFLGLCLLGSLNLAQAKDNFNPSKEYKQNCSICHGANGLKAPPGGRETQLIGAMLKEYVYQRLIDYASDKGGTPGNNFIMFAVMDEYQYTKEEIKQLAEYITDLGHKEME